MYIFVYWFSLLKFAISFEIKFHLYFQDLCTHIIHNNNSVPFQTTINQNAFNDFSIDANYQDVIEFEIETTGNYIGIAGTFMYGSGTMTTNDIRQWHFNLGDIEAINEDYEKDRYPLIRGNTGNIKKGIFSLIVPYQIQVLSPSYNIRGKSEILIFVNDLAHILFNESNVELNWKLRCDSIYGALYDVPTNKLITKVESEHEAKELKYFAFDNDIFIQKVYYTFTNSSGDLSSEGIITFYNCGNECSDCQGLSDDEILNSKCAQCSDGFAFIESISNKCFDISTIGEEYYFDKSNNVYKRCDQRCKSCINESRNCKNCNEGYYFISHQTNPKYCYSQVEFEYNTYEYIDYTKTYSCNKVFILNTTTNKYECINECPSYAPYLLNNQCLKECQSFMKVVYHKKCLDNCPINTYLSDDGINCIDIDNSNLNFTKEDIIQNLPEMIKNSTPNNIIQGEDYIFHIISSDTKEESINNLSSLNLGECEEILKKQYNITEEENLIIAIFDYSSSNRVTNQIEYLIYDISGKPLNLSFCNEVTIEVFYPIKSNEIDFEFWEKMNKKGYDIFNSLDSFFTDICEGFVTENDTDVTLEDRRIDYFKNYSFCEVGCEYIGLNFSQKKVKCVCEPKVYLSLTLKENSHQFQESLINSNRLSNVSIVKCYHKFFENLNIKSNFGFIILTSVFIIQFILMIIFYNVDVHNLYLKLFFPRKIRKRCCCFYQEKTSKQLKKEKLKEKTALESKRLQTLPNIQNKNNISTYKSPNKVKSSLDIYQSTISDNLNNYENRSTAKKFLQSRDAKKSNFVVNNFAVISNPSPPQNEPIENIVFNDTLSSNKEEEVNVESERKEINENDNRIKGNFEIFPKKKEIIENKKGISNIFCTIFWNKFEIVTMFFFTNYFDVFSLSITTFLLAFSFNLFFNALFYTNEVISQRYHDKGNFNCVAPIITSLLSQLLSYIILIFFRKIIFYSPVLDLLSSKFSSKTKYDEKCCKCLSYIKKKMFVYYISNFLFIIWIWYYLSLFCAIFSSSQLNWIINCLFGYLFHFCLMICIVCFITLFRCIAIKYHSKRLNYSSIYFQ